MLKLSIALATMLALSVPAMAQEMQEQDPQTHGMVPGGHSRHGHRDWSTPGQHRHNVCWHLHKGQWVWVCR